MTPTTLPYVDSHIDPTRSYWLDHVHYPWPHQTVRVPDKQRRTWEIAYVDLYDGPSDKEAAPTLVLIHGRGMNCSYWGDLLAKPLAAGWRVVALDWSHSGKSLPLNLHIPVNRLLEDSRQVIYNVVVGHLGIARACYLGHSLGGQTVSGYALQYPQHVERLVLYAATGLEPIPDIRIHGIWLNDPALAGSYQAFRDAWTAAGSLFSMGDTPEEATRAFLEPMRPGRAPYLPRGDALADYIVAMRARCLLGHPAERERYQQCHGWDLFATYCECNVNDPAAIPRRLPDLEVPTLLALGTHEPVYPMWQSGNVSMLDDVVAPLYRAARARRTPLTVKLYEGGGHFLHVDCARDAFCGDVLAFLQGKEVAEAYDAT